MNPPSDSFLFVNKSTKSRTLSRSKAKEKAEIFRHVQRARQKHHGKGARHAARIDIPIRTFSTCWALPDAEAAETPYEHEGSSGTGHSPSDVKRSDAGLDYQLYKTPQLSHAEEEDEVDRIVGSAVTKWQDSAVQWLTGDSFDPFHAFPKMTHYLPATGNCPHPVRRVRSRLFDYIQSLELTDFARKERLFNALIKPSVMFSHLMMVVMEKEAFNEQLAKNLDRVFGTGALRHVRAEVQNLKDHCPWDLICLVNIFMIRAQAAGRTDVAKAHRGGLIAMIERNGGLPAFAATNEMAQGGANGLLVGEFLASAITGEPLHPVLGNVAAGGNFSKHNKDKAPISPLHCVDGDFSELESSPLSRPDTIHLLESIWLLVQSVTQPTRDPRVDKDSMSDYCRARKAILGSREAASLEETRDYIFECCRLTARLLLNATEQHLPLGSCVENHFIVRQLEYHMKPRESSGCWGAFKGVYLNIVLVAYIASPGTSSFRYFQGLAGHAMGYYACSVWEGGYRPLVAMKKFQDVCRSKSALLFS